jgi:hypothetical protein
MKHKNLAVTAFILTLCGALTPCGARTWYVNISGTGDAPTIAAALDSAVAGDTVLVGPGTYGENLDIPPAVVLKSERGPLETYIHGVGDGSIPSPVFAVTVYEHATLDGFRVDQSLSATVSARDWAIVRNNIIGGTAVAGISTPRTTA